MYPTFENCHIGTEYLKRLHLRPVCLKHKSEQAERMGVLVAISIPIFTSQLEKSREAVDLSNIRAAYAECAADVLTGDGKTGYYAKVDPKQTTAGWVSNPDKIAGTLDVKEDGVGKTIVAGTPVYVCVDANGTLSLKTSVPTGTWKDVTTVNNTSDAG